MVPMRRLLALNSPSELKNMRMLGQIDIPKVEFEDFEVAIANTKPSVGSESIGRFEAWDRDFGSK
jgi:Vps4 C terminal oligomerisation domain